MALQDPLTLVGERPSAVKRAARWLLIAGTVVGLFTLGLVIAVLSTTR